MRCLRLEPWLVLIAVALPWTGCAIENEPEPEAPPPPSSTQREAESVSIEASAPFSMEDDLPPERLEAERFDPSWQQYARENLAGTTAPAGRERPGAGATGSARESDALANPYLGRLRAADAERQAQGAGAGRAADETPEPEAPAAAADADAEPRAQSAGAGRAADGPPEPEAPAAAADAGAPNQAAERWEDISPESLRDAEPRLPVATDGGGPTVLRLQWLLDRVGFSPGSLDGRWGKNTEKAVYWLQQSLGLEPNGRVDRDLYERLLAAVADSDEPSPVRRYTVSAEDLEGPFVEVPEDPEAQAELDCLCYASPVELLVERFHTTPEILAQLNQGTDLAGIEEGTEIWVPAVEVAEPGDGERVADSPIERVVISRGGFYIHALDQEGDIVYHFPSTMGSRYNPSPEGGLKIEGVAWRPNFHYQPDLLATPGVEAATDEELMLPPGPNSPVGLVWMQLSKPHYGIHGTARPETIGYSTSHGCIRMTNWDAIYLGQRVGPGTAVEFRP